MAEPRVKKPKKCSRVCRPCRSAKTACDNGRPCIRCVRLGKGHLCIDVELKRSYGGTPTSLMKKQQHQQQQLNNQQRISHSPSLNMNTISLIESQQSNNVELFHGDLLWTSSEQNLSLNSNDNIMSPLKQSKTFVDDISSVPSMVYEASREINSIVDPLLASLSDTPLSFSQDQLLLTASPSDDTSPMSPFLFDRLASSTESSPTNGGSELDSQWSDMFENFVNNVASSSSSSSTLVGTEQSCGDNGNSNEWPDFSQISVDNSISVPSPTVFIGESLGSDHLFYCGYTRYFKSLHDELLQWHAKILSNYNESSANTRVLEVAYHVFVRFYMGHSRNFQSLSEEELLAECKELASGINLDCKAFAHSECENMLIKRREISDDTTAAYNKLPIAVLRFNFGNMCMNLSYINSSASQLFGYSLSELEPGSDLRTQMFFRILHPMEWSNFGKTFSFAVVENKENFHYKGRFLACSGDSVIALMSACLEFSCRRIPVSVTMFFQPDIPFSSSLDTPLSVLI